MTPETFAQLFDVSRETKQRLEDYVALLGRWNHRINLVARRALNDVWSRHIADSAQLLNLAPPNAATWIDLGSGAGFPGLVVAVMAAERHPGLQVRLVESDRRKAAFLAEVIRQTSISAKVEACRIEGLPAERQDVISARALAPLEQLCSLAQRFVGPHSVLLFPKGARLESELTAAAALWHIRAERIPSRTDPAAAVLVIRELRKRS